MWPAEDCSDLARRPNLILVVLWHGASIADIVLEVSFLDEVFNLILERDALFCGVANISIISAVFVLIPLRALSPHRIGSFVHARVLRGQEYILTRPYQVGEVIVLAWRRVSGPSDLGFWPFSGGRMEIIGDLHLFVSYCSRSSRWT